MRLALVLLLLCPLAAGASDFTMSTVIARVTGMSRTMHEASGVVVRSTVTQKKVTFNEATQSYDEEEFTTECPGDRCYQTSYMTCPYLAAVLVVDDTRGAQIVTILNCVSTTSGTCGHVNGTLREVSGFIALADGILYSSRGCG
jgi:hypothetical protein